MRCGCLQLLHFSVKNNMNNCYCMPTISGIETHSPILFTNYFGTENNLPFAFIFMHAILTKLFSEYEIHVLRYVSNFASKCILLKRKLGDTNDIIYRTSVVRQCVLCLQMMLKIVHGLLENPNNNYNLRSVFFSFFFLSFFLVLL